MKKFLRRFALIVLLSLVVLQLPFVYRRCQLGAVQKKINEFNANRTARAPEGFKSYKGVVHVHTFLGGHSAGTFKELIEAANSNDLDFVLLTEHPSPLYDTAKQSLNGVYGKTLFVAGNEVSSKQGDRFLILPGSADANRDTTQNTVDLLNKEKAAGKLALITYPEKYKAWNEAPSFDGIEVYSLHTNAKSFPKFLALFDFIWSFSAYPELAQARFFKRPDANLQKFDELTVSGKRLTLFGAADAHSNIGVTLGDRANHEWLKIHLDPYAQTFRLVQLYVLLPENRELTQENLLAAIAEGRCYLAFDVYGNAQGFDFRAIKTGEVKTIGEEIAVGENLNLTARAPIKCRFALFRNGAKIQEFADAAEMNFAVREAGVYRVEVYLDALEFNDAPWIVSNPIYVR